MRHWKKLLRVIFRWSSFRRLITLRSSISDEFYLLDVHDRMEEELRLFNERQAQLKEIERYNMTSKEQFYNKPLSKLSYFKKKEGLIGLEIECEGTSLFKDTFNYWSCHNDGSLRVVKGHEPVEYVLTEPVSRSVLKKALEYLEAKFKAAGSSVIDSTRTSVHVHLNVQNYTVRQLYNFICLYLIFEEILVEWCGPTRVGNCFTLRAKDSDYYVQMLERALKDGSLKAWNENVRYAACNIASIPKFGSLEFRSLRGTVDIEIIQVWVDVLLNLKSQSERYDNPIEIVNDFIALGPLPFFRKIFGNDRQRAMFESFDQLSGKLWDGLRLMRDVAHMVEWLPPIKKNPGDPPEKEVSPWGDRVGQLVILQGANYIVETWATGENDRALNVYDYDIHTGHVGPRYMYTLPPYHRIYYAEVGAAWIKLDVVPETPDN